MIYDELQPVPNTTQLIVNRDLKIHQSYNFYKLF